MKNQAGFTLIQLMIVLAIVAVVSVLTAKELYNDLDTDLLKSVPEKLARLNKAVTAYHDSYCHAGPVTAPTMEQLASQGYLASNNTVALPVGATLQTINFERISSEVVFAYVLTFETPSAALHAAAMQSNVEVIGNTATWRFSRIDNSTINNIEANEYLTAFGVNNC